MTMRMRLGGHALLLIAAGLLPCPGAGPGPRPCPSSAPAPRPPPMCRSAPCQHGHDAQPSMPPRPPRNIWPRCQRRGARPLRRLFRRRLLAAAGGPDLCPGRGGAAAVAALSSTSRDWAEERTRSRWVQELIYVAVYVPPITVASLPLTLYEGFFREHAYGLSTQSFLALAGRFRHRLRADAGRHADRCCRMLYAAIRGRAKTGGCGARTGHRSSWFCNSR